VEHAGLEQHGATLAASDALGGLDPDVPEDEQGALLLGTSDRARPEDQSDAPVARPPAARKLPSHISKTSHDAGRTPALYRLERPQPKGRRMSKRHKREPTRRDPAGDRARVRGRLALEGDVGVAPPPAPAPPPHPANARSAPVSPCARRTRAAPAAPA